MRNEFAGDKARGAAGSKSWLRSISNRVRIAAKDRSELQTRQMELALGPTVEERQNDLIQFYERYEELVEVLFHVVKSQAAGREIDDFMTVPRSRPG